LILCAVDRSSLADPAVTRHRIADRYDQRCFYDGWVSDREFSPQERRAVYRVISERRDMRRFVPGSKVPDDVLARLLQAAHAAPNVGLMQPWRFIRITDDELRRRIHALVDEERQQTAHALGERAQEFLALKVEGILDCCTIGGPRDGLGIAVRSAETGGLAVDARRRRAGGNSVPRPGP
jgi:hypothetical protein